MNPALPIQEGRREETMAELHPNVKVVGNEAKERAEGAESNVSERPVATVVNHREENEPAALAVAAAAVARVVALQEAQVHRVVVGGMCVAVVAIAARPPPPHHHHRHHRRHHRLLLQVILASHRPDQGQVDRENKRHLGVSVVVVVQHRAAAPIQRLEISFVD
jgi:hypothetical protein